MITEGYLLDTSVASWVFDAGNPNHEQARVNLEVLGNSPVYISAITIGEIEYGLSLPRTGADQERASTIRHALRGYGILTIARHTAETYGLIRATIFDRHAPRDARHRVRTKQPEDLTDQTSGKELGIQENDLWIVSSAMTHNLRFVTNDRAGGMRRIIEAADYNNPYIFR